MMATTARLTRESDTYLQQDPEGGESQFKKRRTPGACDTCKRKKIRCDSSETSDNRCTNCTQAGLTCTHKEAARTLGPAKSYVESLEARLEKMDKLMNKFLPEIDVNQELERVEVPSGEPEILSRNDDETIPMIVQLHKLKLNTERNRFFGKSSCYQLLQTALDLKLVYTGATHQGIKREQKWRRYQFWELPKWAGPDAFRDHWQDAPTYVYPPDDLMPSLIDAYFTHLNPFSPLLHRPTFERSVAKCRHLTDSQFGATLLLVCAHGAKYIDDPRVLVDGQGWLSAGWKWFEQVNLFKKTLHNKVTLCELQIFALHAEFLQSSPTPQGVWVEIGYAMRLALEVGAHRKRKRDDTSINEDELWKRAFWVIFAIDRRVSAESGRSPAVHDEDFDLDLPLECDDEYWDLGFVQPPGKPSTITFFNCYLRLLNIIGHAMRLIYSIKRPNSSFQNGRSESRADQDLIVELDSMLNAWMDSVPPHLKWHTTHSTSCFLYQSAFLHASYYHLQIFIHRPFVPTPRNPRPSSFPSLAVCTNAARSCCHVMESFRNGPPLPLTFELAFSAAIILLLNVWSGKRSGFAPNPKREMQDVQRCMQILQAAEDRWSSAGKYLDMLVELSFSGDLSVIADFVPSVKAELEALKAKQSGDSQGSSYVLSPDPISGSEPTHGRKRSRNEADEDSGHASSSADHTQRMAGTKRGLQSSRMFSPGLLDNPARLSFPLPISSVELGALPIYGQFGFLDSITSNIPATADNVHDGGPDLSAAPLRDDTFSSFSTTLGSNLLVSGTGSFQQAVFPDHYHTSPSGQADTVSMSSHENSILPGTPLGGSVTPASSFPNSTGSQRADDLATFLGLDGSHSSSMQPIDATSMRMWSTALTNMEFEDWNSYVTDMELIAQGKEPDPEYALKDSDAF